MQRQIRLDYLHYSWTLRRIRLDSISYWDALTGSSRTSAYKSLKQPLRIDIYVSKSHFTDRTKRDWVRAV